MPNAATALEHWSVNDEPAADTVASATKAAGAAGVRHVATSITACITGATAAVSTVRLLDGASVIWAGRISVGTATGSGFLTVSGLNIPGSPATAMTLEVSDPGVATASVSAALTGYSVP